MNKRAQMSYVVAIILILLAFFIIWGIAGKVFQIMRGAGSDAACTASAQLSSKTKVAGVETVSLNCPMKLAEITMEDLTAEVGKARSALGKIEEHNKKYPENQIELEYFMNPDLSKYKEFILDKKVAEEMQNCWQKLGEGELDLFSAWYAPIETGGDKPWKRWIPHLVTPPITCVICSRIKFDKGVQETYPKIVSMNEWLKINTVPKRSITYYDYLIDELHDQYLFTPDWNFETDEPVAVVFARMNPQYSVGFLSGLLDTFGITDIGKAQQAVDVLYLIEYSNAGGYCNYLANKPPEEK